VLVTIAWVAALTRQYFLSYKTPGTLEEEHEAVRRRIQEWSRMRELTRRAKRRERREKQGVEEKRDQSETIHRPRTLCGCTKYFQTNIRYDTDD
jgi:hypothetical protein